MQTIEPITVAFAGLPSLISVVWIDAPEGVDRPARTVALTSHIDGMPDGYIVVGIIGGQWRDLTYEMTAEQMTNWTSYRRGEHSRPLCDPTLREWLDRAVAAGK